MRNLSRNEFTYGQPTMSTGTLAMTKLKNRLKKLDPDLVFHLKNVRINGITMGCSGFVVNPANDAIVYVNTDHNHGTSMDRAYYRTAEHLKDYTGGRNHFATYDELPQAVVDMLQA